MKKLLIILLSASLAIFSSSVQAQKETKKWSLGISSEVGIPQGQVKTSFKIESAIGLRLSIHAGPGFVTLSSGVNFYLPKVNLKSLNVSSDSTLFDSTFNLSKLKTAIQVPVTIGYKYIFGHYFFVMGEIGYSNFLYYYGDTSDNVHSIHSYGLIYALSAGVQFNWLELGVRYSSLGATGGTLSPAGKTISTLGLRLAFNF